MIVTFASLPGWDLRRALGPAFLRHYRDDIVRLPRGEHGGLSGLVRLFHTLLCPVDLDQLAGDLREFVPADAAEQGKGECQTTTGIKGGEPSD